MKGRRYRLCSGALGTQLASAQTSASMLARKSAASSTGSASRRAERPIRAAFRSGRNNQTLPSGCRYALSPSKTSCA